MLTVLRPALPNKRAAAALRALCAVKLRQLIELISERRARLETIQVFS